MRTLEPMRVLFLDDDPTRFDVLTKIVPWDILWVQRVAPFLHCARTRHFDLIMMDHDLGCVELLWDETLPGFGVATEHTGFDAVVALLREPGNALGTPVRVHSHNPGGSSRMYRALKEAGWEVRQEEF